MKIAYRCLAAGIASLAFGLSAQAQAPGAAPQDRGNSPTIRLAQAQQPLPGGAPPAEVGAPNQPIPGGAGAPSGPSLGEPSLGGPALGGPGGFGTGQQGSFRAPSPIVPGQPISVLVFPLSAVAAAEAPPAAPADAGAVAPRVQTPEQRDAAYATATLKAGLLSSPYFSVATFHPNSALVQRAVRDEILRPEQTQVSTGANGDVDPARARDLTYRLGIQTMLIGSVDVKSDRTANKADATIEAQLLNSTTGEPLRSAAATGSATGSADVPEEFIRQRAIQDAVQKLLPGLGIQLVQQQPATKAQEGEKQPAEKKAKRQRGRKAAADAAEATEAANTTTEPTPAAAAPAVRATPTPAGDGTVPGVSNASGQPIPYGYAVAEEEAVLPERKREGLRVPPWLGVAGFLFGVSFLL